MSNSGRDSEAHVELRALYRKIRDETWHNEIGKSGVLAGIALSVARLDKIAQVDSNRDSIYFWLNCDQPPYRPGRRK